MKNIKTLQGYRQHNMETIPLFSSPLVRFDGYIITDEILNKIESLPKNLNDSNSISKANKVLLHPDFSAIREYCEYQLNKYVKDILNCSNEIYITTSWFNYTKKGESHHLHTHPNSLISGVMYFKGTPKISFMRNEQPFCLDLNINEYNLATAEEWIINCKPGELLLFPSKVRHSVDEYKENDTRISLSFNTFVKGHLSEGTSKLEIK